mmetsp:Transcript_44345/g.126965  ORF Transcript_44345/g.126965 Transcript_44345/m.126965 type:complete len:123 (+) Transcript_44345:111-479(+)
MGRCRASSARALVSNARQGSSDGHEVLGDDGAGCWPQAPHHQGRVATLQKSTCENFFRTACSGLFWAASRMLHISCAQSLTAGRSNLQCLATMGGQEGCCFMSLLLSRVAAATKWEGSYLII